MKKIKISILMLTYNAPNYVLKSIYSLRKTKSKVPYELIVLDNCSHQTTRWILRLLKKMLLIDKLFLNDKNDLFARGNNLASTFSAADSTHYLLLNSDIKVMNPNWLDRLIDECTSDTGIVSYGVVKTPPLRADGYCFLIRKSLYDRYQLDEEFEWWWSITKLQSKALKDGWKIKGFENHDSQLIHYGGASTKGIIHAKGMDITKDEVMAWFDDCQNQVEILTL